MPSTFPGHSPHGVGVGSDLSIEFSRNLIAMEEEAGQSRGHS